MGRAPLRSYWRPLNVTSMGRGNIRVTPRVVLLGSMPTSPCDNSYHSVVVDTALEAAYGMAVPSCNEATATFNRTINSCRSGHVKVSRPTTKCGEMDDGSTTDTYACHAPSAVRLCWHAANDGEKMSGSGSDLRTEPSARWMANRCLHQHMHMHIHKMHARENQQLNRKAGGHVDSMQALPSANTTVQSCLLRQEAEQTRKSICQWYPWRWGCNSPSAHANPCLAMIGFPWAERYPRKGRPAPTIRHLA